MSSGNSDDGFISHSVGSEIWNENSLVSHSVGIKDWNTNSPITTTSTEVGGLGRIWEEVYEESSGEFLVVQGGYVYTFGNTGYDFVLVKWNMEGTILWNIVLEEFTHTYIYDFAGDGESLYVTGYNQTDTSGFIAKIGSNGTILWNSPLSSLGFSICAYQEYIYVVNGSLNKINPINGHIVNSNHEVGAYFVKEGKNSLYLLTNIVGNNFLVRWSDDNVVWSKSINSAYQKGLLESEDFLYYLSGDISDKSLILSKLGAEKGESIWNITDSKIIPRGFAENDGNLYVVGATSEYTSRLSIVGYSPIDGNLLWEKSWRTEEYGDQTLSDIAFGENDTIYTLGSESEMVLTKWIYDVELPTLNDYADVCYEQSDSVFSLRWYAYDENPTSYLVYKNGRTVDSGNWTSGEAIEIEIDQSSALGQYNYTIIVEDLSGNIASDSVMVTIQDTIAPYIRDDINDNVIIWNINDRNPGSYEVYKNGLSVLSGDWVDNGNISIDITDNGNYTIVAKDTSNNMAKGIVIIDYISTPSSVNSSDTSTVFAPNNILSYILYLVILLVPVLLIVIIILLRRGREED